MGERSVDDELCECEGISRDGGGACPEHSQSQVPRIRVQEETFES